MYSSNTYFAKSSLTLKKKKVTSGAREVAQWLGAQLLFTEDLSSTPTQHPHGCRSQAPKGTRHTYGTQIHAQREH